MKKPMHGVATRPSRRRWWRCAAGIAILAVALLPGCVASDTIVELPPPQGLSDLRQLENHLDYVDPDDGKPTYVPERTQGER